MTSVLTVASEASNVVCFGTRFSAVRLRRQLEAVVNRTESIQHGFATLQAGGQLHSQDAAGEHAEAG